MAKTARKNRKRNARRKARELRATMRGDGQRAKARNPMVLGLILRNGTGMPERLPTKVHVAARSERTKLRTFFLPSTLIHTEGEFL